jgi:hypothetical protein
MSISIVIALLSAMSLIVGITGGCIGAYVTMKVGVVRLETWRELMSEALKDAQGDIRVLTDDSVTYDTELGLVMGHLNIARTRRQRFRD